MDRGCRWTVTITGSWTYVTGRTSRRLAWLEVISHEGREHFPGDGELLKGFLRDEPVIELEPDAIFGIAGSVQQPRAEAVAV